MIALTYTVRAVESLLMTEVSVSRSAGEGGFILAGTGSFSPRFFISSRGERRAVDGGRQLLLGERDDWFAFGAAIGLPGKHGLQGVLAADCSAFELSRAVLLPYPQNGLEFVCRFRFELPSGPVSLRADIREPYDMVRAGKNSVVSGPAPTDPSGVVSQLYAYFSALFGQPAPDWRLFLLPSGGERVFAGSGADSAAFAFDQSRERDCELLAHRMCHAYFARTPFARRYAEPENVFLEEGLASLHELLAVHPDPRRALFDVYRRYLFFRFSRPEFAFSPLDADAPQKPWLAEFFHYTFAPLLVYAAFGRGFAPVAPEQAMASLRAAGLLTAEPLFLPEFDGFGDGDPSEGFASLRSYEALISSWRGEEDMTEPMPSAPEPATALGARLRGISASLYAMLCSRGANI